MYGAVGLKPDLLQGDILLNTDSEEEGDIYMSCAGGVDLDISFRFNEIPYIASEEELAMKLRLTGLKGGHSGVDIHLGRANANKLMFRFLKYAVQEYEARLAWVSGGNMRNAIPREAVAIVIIPAEWKDDFVNEVADYEFLYKHEYATMLFLLQQKKSKLLKLLFLKRYKTI